VKKPNSMSDRHRPITSKPRNLYLDPTIHVVPPMRLIYTDCRFTVKIGLTDRYVEEAAHVFEMRVQACQQRGENHLHVYLSIPNPY
jgi:hypothetical protein